MNSLPVNMLLRISLNNNKLALKNVIKRKSIGLRHLSVNSDDYQYIEHSWLPTMHFQKSLPRLPIPQLDKTCERYLAALTPLLPSEKFERTVKLVNQFKQNEGKNLDGELRKHDILHSDTSYVSEPWFDMYLSDRVPLPINYNPVLVFNKSKQSENDSQLVKASNLLISSLRFMKSLRKNILSPEVYHLNPKKSDTDVFRNVTRLLPSSVSWYGAYLFKAFPLDMSQFSSLFGSTRIPQLEKDVLFKDESSRHVLVLRKGHFFVFDVLDKNGNILPPNDIFACLKYITDKDLKQNVNSLGLLTTENRDNWAKSREHIVTLSKENVESLNAIDSSLFVLCLDDEEIKDDWIKMMSQFLHGDGFNRWFDKSFSLILSKDSYAAVNFEHSWGDGVAVLRYFQDIYKDTNNRLFVQSSVSTSNIDPVNSVRELSFKLDEKAMADVNAAREKFENVCKSLAFNVVECRNLGKDNCKSSKVSPDSIMQLAFQVAYHKIYLEFATTYESCSTAAFKHGRTETVRPCTMKTKEFALSMNREKRADRATLMDLMKECSSVHMELIKKAAMGEGFDRHLFAIKNLATRAGFQLPDLYLDEAYTGINYNILSTSTLSSEAVLTGGFGPVVPDGLGVGYTISNDFCGAVISSYPARRSGGQFAEALESVLHDFSDMFCSK